MHIGKNEGRLPENYCNLYFNKPITRWDEAIPLGNGMMGCLVWGDGFPLRMSLDRGDLWDKRVSPQVLAQDYTYEELIKLVKDKDHKAITKRFDEFYFEPTPTKIPAGALELNYGMKCQSMESRLVLSGAAGEVRLEYNEGYSEIRTFLHATEFYGYISIEGSIEAPQILLKAPGFAFSPDEGKEPAGLELLGYPAAVTGQDGALSWFCQKASGGLEYALVAAKKRLGCNKLDIAYVAASNLDGENWLENAKSKVLKAVETGYEKAVEGHERWWRDFWSKSSVGIADREYEKMWYLTNYLFGSCSRKGFPPMPLQGVWTADDGGLPPWKGDYHHDLNTQLSYWHYLKANHLEEGESFIDFLWTLVPTARKFAEEFFNAPGICLPSVMSIDGKSLGGWPMYATNLVNQIWLCQAFEHYWKYTGNVEFLKERAYPYFKETAACILHWLKPGPDGKLALPLSSSPEIHENSLEAWLKPNSNNDLSLLIYLFKTLSAMSETLDNGEKQVWEDKLMLLPELSVNEHNVLMLSPDESLAESHRHHAHTMSVYPLKLLNYYTGGRDKEIIDATIENMEVLGTGWWVGFSFAWMADLYAVQGNGEGAAYQLKLFWENFCSPNGFHVNGDFKKRGLSSFHYRPFTLEANMAAADALQEMLLQTDNGVIRVFPAVPNAWRLDEVSFKDFRGEKGVLISSAVVNGEVEYIRLKAENTCTYKVVNTLGSDRLLIKTASCEKPVICEREETFDIHVEKGEVCVIVKCT